MDRNEFKLKYFTNSFYWVNQENYKELQEIGIEFECLNPVMKPEIIEWHDGFNNLGFRTYERHDNVTRFQKEGFLLSNETAVDYHEMISDYKNLEKSPKTINK